MEHGDEECDNSTERLHDVGWRKERKGEGGGAKSKWKLEEGAARERLNADRNLRGLSSLSLNSIEPLVCANGA